MLTRHRSHVLRWRAHRPLRGRARLVREEGMAAVAPLSIARWFTPAFIAQMWEMISHFDVEARLPALALPTLVIVGADDTSTPPASAQLVANAIKGARLKTIENSSHLVTLEAPDAVNTLLREFLA